MAKENITQLTTNEYQRLVKENVDLQSKINDLNVKIGELRNDLFSEKNNSKKDTDNSGKVIIKTVRQRSDGWGSYKDDLISVSTIGLSDVKDDLRKEVSKELEVDTVKLMKENSKLKLNLEERRIMMDELKQEQEATIDHQVKLQYNSIKRDKENMVIRHREQLESKDKFIDKLQEDLKKEKNNKTDRELMEKRNKEIKTLKERIHELEEQVAHLNDAGWFTRLLDRISNYHTRKQAIKDKARKIKEVDEVKEVSAGPGYSQFGKYFNWITR